MYIDGFVTSVKADDRQTYVDFCNKMDPIFVEYGATRVVDGWGDDVPHGERTDFYRAVAAEENETVVFGYIEWPDKATRDAGFAAVMADERMDGATPFDGKRMILGGFDAISVKSI